MKRQIKTAIALVIMMITLSGAAFAQQTVSVYETEWGQGQVNVNTATRDQLIWFLGQTNIGNPDKLADSILAYRNANGPFDTVDELKNVQGIDPTALYRLQYRVKVTGTTDYDPELVLPAPGTDEPYRPSKG